jgi:hypothetical protein
MEDIVKVIIACATGVVIGVVLCALMKKSLAEILPNLQSLQLLSASPIPRYQYQNIEEIEWEDWRGRKRKIVIHRRVE